MMVMGRKNVVRAVWAILSLPLLLALIEAVAFHVANRDNGAMVSSGESRTYLLYVPSSYDRSKPTPLVISLHGAALWGAGQMEISQWNRVADREGFIVVYPSGVEGHGPRIWRADGGAGLTKDVRFISDLIDTLEAAYNIDAAVCQSMYAEVGQAELFVQPSGSDVDQAVSLSGKRYADQPYAFEYRQSYNESCHSELKTGISALAVRYLNAPPMTKGGKGAQHMSALDANLTGGVEDLSLAGSPVEAAAAPVPAGAHEPVTEPDPNRPVRFVSDAYDELFDLSRPAKPVPEHRRRSLSTVDTSQASDSTRVETNRLSPLGVVAAMLATTTVIVT